MPNNLKLAHANINREELSEQLNKKGIFYGNVVIWTIMFSLPLFWLMDFLFVSDQWVDFMLIRVIVAIISYIIYFLGLRLKWDFTKILLWFILINLVMHSVFCGIIATSHVLPYFLTLSILVLLINTVIFWQPMYSILNCLLSFFIIFLFFSFKGRVDKYNLMIAHGGGVYFIIASFSCLIVYNRYSILTKEVEESILIEEANNRLLEQYEKINDQKYIIEDTNKKLNLLNDYRHNTLNIMLHDFKNFTGSIQMSLELLLNKSDNLTQEQKEILAYIGSGNDKLNYLSEKLATSVDRDEANVKFAIENFDLNQAVEKAVIESSDAAQIKQISLQLHISSSPVMVQLDYLFLLQVLFKTLTNVYRYAEAGSIVTIHTHKLNGKSIIEVINIGKLIGITKMKELFSKLKPGQSLSDTVKGDSEMGFSVAKNLTETMGGTFTFNSNDTMGNYYRIEFN